EVTAMTDLTQSQKPLESGAQPQSGWATSILAEGSKLTPSWGAFRAYAAVMTTIAVVALVAIAIIAPASRIELAGAILVIYIVAVSIALLAARHKLLD